MEKNLELKKIILAGSMGFCAGVRRALDKTRRATLTTNSLPIYLNHSLVHNEDVQEGLLKQGVIELQNVSEIPKQSTWIISAHGVDPHLRHLAEEKNLRIIDATCPLVEKTHLQITRLATQGYELIILGDSKHVEILGLQGCARLKKIPVTILSNLKDVENFQKLTERPLAFVTQTTLSEENFQTMYRALQKKYKNISGSKRGDICYATLHRQSALKQLIKKVDAVIILGSQNSSNAKKLLQIAEKSVPAFLIRSIKFLDFSKLSNIAALGITAAASTPDCILDECLAVLQQSCKSNLTIIKDDADFPEPFEFDSA